MTDETREERMVRLRADSTMSPERRQESADLRACFAAAAREKWGPIREGDIGRTRWAEPNHMLVVRPAPDSRPTQDEGGEG